MKEIKVASGYEEIKINDAASVWLNPTDIGFLERYFDTFEEVDALQEQYQNKMDKADGRAAFDIARAIDADIREKINGLFGTDLCTELFGEMHVTAVADGLPVWCNLLLAFVELFDDTVVAEKKKMNPRLEKYIKRFSRK